MEYGFKIGYAKLIKLGTQTAFEQGDGLIYMTADLAESTLAPLEKPAEMIKQHEDAYLLSVPRWGEFTNTIPLLAKHGYDFENISGNKVITLTLILNTQESFYSKYASILFSSTLVSDANKKRVAVVTKVEDLKEFILDSTARGQTIEHIYDY